MVALFVSGHLVWVLWKPTTRAKKHAYFEFVIYFLGYSITLNVTQVNWLESIPIHWTAPFTRIVGKFIAIMAGIQSIISIGDYQVHGRLATKPMLD
jgi:hypothetical protein